MRVKNDRSFILYIILSLCTCGLYELYFIYSVARDTNTICSREDRQNTAGLLVYILLTILTCGFYPIYWFYRIGDRIASNAKGQFGIEIKENGTTMLLWWVIGLVVCNIATLVPYYYLIKNLNILASAYNEQFDYSAPTYGSSGGGYSAPANSYIATPAQSTQQSDGGEKTAE